MVAYAVHDTGRREVIGIDLGETETEAFWVEFLRGLRSRGLGGVRLCVSDHHEGLKEQLHHSTRLDSHFSRISSTATPSSYGGPVRRLVASATTPFSHADHRTGP